MAERMVRIDSRATTTADRSRKRNATFGSWAEGGVNYETGARKPGGWRAVPGFDGALFWGRRPPDADPSHPR
jgi:hypothetical protein